MVPRYLQSLCRRWGCHPCVAGVVWVQTGARAAGEEKINPGLIISPKSFLSPRLAQANASSPASFKGCAVVFFPPPPPDCAGLGTARGFVTAQQSWLRGWHLLFSRERLNLGQEYMCLVFFFFFSNSSGACWNPAFPSPLLSLPRVVPAAGGTDPARGQEDNDEPAGSAAGSVLGKSGPGSEIAARRWVYTCWASRIRPRGGFGPAPEPPFGRFPLPSPCLHLEARHRNPDSIILKPE